MAGAWSDEASSDYGDSQLWNIAWVTAVHDGDDVCLYSLFEWSVSRVTFALSNHSTCTREYLSLCQEWDTYPRIRSGDVGQEGK